MKKDKLTYNSNAKIRNFTIDDIGKLSINDIKKLKDMFGPKPRQSTKKKKDIIEDDLDIPNVKNNGVKTGIDHMKGFTENLKPTQTNPFFRGYVPNPSNLLMLENSGDNTRFVNKSNLNIDDVNNAIKTNINPLLDNVREEAKNKLLNEFKPHLDNFENTTRFIKNDYDKFRNDIDKDIRELYSMNQGDDDYSNIDYQDFSKSKPKITVFDDDAGNFGGSNGSDNFVSLNDKNDFKENLQMGNNENQKYNEIPDIGDLFFDEELPVNYKEEKEPEPEPELQVNYKVNDGAPQIDNQFERRPEPQQPQIDLEEIIKTKEFERYMNFNIKSDEAKQLYIDLGGNEQNIINASGKGSINKVRGGISKLLKDTYNYHDKATTKDAKTNEWKIR